MLILLRIAFRNILMNKKRAFMIGFAIFISSFLLLVSNAFMNGANKQVMRGYLNIQSGDVSVVWAGLKNIKNNDASRLLFTAAKNISFDIAKDKENRQSISELNKFVQKNSDDIKGFYPSIRRSSQLYKGTKVDMVIVYSLNASHAQLLQDSGAITISEGKLLTDGSNVCISREKATTDNIKLGDTVKIAVRTPSGKLKSVDFNVDGIYNNGAGYDNYYGFMSDAAAKSLFEIDARYFDIANIFLKDGSNSLSTIENLSSQLDNILIASGGVLRSETYSEASQFYTRTSVTMKLMFNVFIVFFLFVIAIGLRATVRMNLFERMKEFGTLRAIGFSKGQCYTIIFNEVFILSAIALGAAFIISAILILILQNTGIYVGAGAMSYSFGGESLYPSMRLGDILFSIAVIALLSLVATVNPGLRLCHQKITDILAKRQKRIYPMLGAVKRVLSRGKVDES